MTPSDLTIGNTDYRTGDENGILPGHTNVEEIYREIKDPGNTSNHSQLLMSILQIKKKTKTQSTIRNKKTNQMMPNHKDEPF